MKILMVCLGNICRSPLAHGLLRAKLKDTNSFVDSAGTASYHVGEAPDVRMIKTARNHGINISDLRGMQFSVNHFDEFDKIYVMDESNYNNVINLARTKSDKSKVEMILNQIKPNSNAAVPDPYYGGDEGFENVFKMLNQATDIIAEKVKNGEL